MTFGCVEASAAEETAMITTAWHLTLAAVLGCSHGGARQLPGNEKAKKGVDALQRKVADPQVPPSQQIALSIEVKDVEKTVAQLKDAVQAVKGKVVADTQTRDPNGKTTAFLLFDVPLTARDELVKKLKGIGVLREFRSSIVLPDAKVVHIDVLLTNVPRSDGPDDQALAKPVLQRHEYKVVFCPVDLDGPGIAKQEADGKVKELRHGPKQSAESMTNQFNALAAEGWEYIGPVISTMSPTERLPVLDANPNHGVLVIFRRTKVVSK